MDYVYDEDYLIMETTLEREDAVFHFSQTFPGRRDVTKIEIEKLIDDLVEFNVCTRKMKRAGRPFLAKKGMSGIRKPFSIVLDLSTSESIDKNRSGASRSDYIESCVMYVDSLLGGSYKTINDLVKAQLEKVVGNGKD